MTPAKAESGERVGRPDLHVRLNLKVGTMQMQLSSRRGMPPRRGSFTDAARAVVNGRGRRGRLVGGGRGRVNRRHHVSPDSSNRVITRLVMDPGGQQDTDHQKERRITDHNT